MDRGGTLGWGSSNVLIVYVFLFGSLTSGRVDLMCLIGMGSTPDLVKY